MTVRVPHEMSDGGSDKSESGASGLDEAAHGARPFEKFWPRVTAGP